ncbi:MULTISPECIES: glycosyltransferase family 8 protein [unclassified Tolypothrix]|uniref:glycosyltransferase family 8 protein n=1 Tax=unclassified Tolypothrix TaxID=2649714 RepID=UPI0005EAA657|nr:MULTISPECIES: glycosyltransferase family 8 protein [unclassified Tolypothrix]BAY92029.1 glycosyl transferase family 8 [Microchaete diplosiphon NIES-3275]EKF04775.1 glycosyl transferase family 8 [Tolypothrix sp. PCC 7601]MBE9081766.1 glycosyltransferase family 8 protein [Tolypothrix sp. LEGE 11397]UYD26017.1 glycosyltransferase family 8 protein [Tolypothrix sp. PCC 7712]UYD31744.1 glycosyltransferase family 8 protein [Tolypothrix sp. PCC 7601]
MNIVCTIDNNYAQHCAVMLSSLFINNPNQKFYIYIITNGLKKHISNKIKRFFYTIKQEYSIIEIQTSELEKAPVSHHISLATYFRLFIPEVIPDNIDKILFIDSDIIIRKSIDQLWSLDIQSFSHAAAIASGMDDYPSKINLPEGSLYFNAGLMLINLKAWREMKVFHRGCALIYQQPELLQWWDQDVLNILLNNSWLPVDLTWNSQPYLYDESLINSKYQDKYKKFNYLEAKIDPAIVHFVGGGSAKPWHLNCNHPFKHEYFKYLKKTPWKNSHLIGKPSFISKIRFYLGLGSKLHNFLQFLRTKLFSI